MPTDGSKTAQKAGAYIILAHGTVEIPCFSMTYNLIAPPACEKDRIILNFP